MVFSQMWTPCLFNRQNLQQNNRCQVIILIYSYSVRNMSYFQISPNNISTSTIFPPARDIVHSLYCSLKVPSVILDRLYTGGFFFFLFSFFFSFLRTVLFCVFSCLFRKAHVFEEQTILLSFERGI